MALLSSVIHDAKLSQKLRTFTGEKSPKLVFLKIQGKCDKGDGSFVAPLKLTKDGERV